MKVRALAFLSLLLLSGCQQQAPVVSISGDYLGNPVYGGAMTLAWKDLSENIVGEPVQLQLTEQDAEAQALVDQFNAATFSTDDLDEENYYVKSGYGQETVDLVNKESREKFPDKSFSDLSVQLEPLDILTYAYFLVQVKYPLAFKEGTMEFMDENVESFYTHSDEQRENVEVLHYWDNDKFILRLKVNEDGEDLIVAKGFDMENPDAILAAVTKYTDSEGSLDDSEFFEMPKLHLDYSYSYDDLLGKYLANLGFEDYKITEMFENIKFDMDHEGARVENEAVIQVMYDGLLPSAEESREFILNKPFWVVMKKSDSTDPYFMLGVNNTVVMER